MEFPRDPDKQKQLQYEATARNNELLEQLIQLLKPKLEEIKTEEPMKRPAMLKLISGMKNKPEGFNKWGNDKLISYLKEANHEQSSG